jgi:outer membrane protein TolC
MKATNGVVATFCALAALLPAVASAQTGPTVTERLSLERAIRLAVENNTQLQSARLEIGKADADLASARTRRLPAFSTELTASQLVTPINFAFPQGAFGTYPGTGPIPSTDMNVSVPRQPTFYMQSQVSQPLTQLFRIGLGIKSAAATREIEVERVRDRQLSIVNEVRRGYFAILQTQSALAANEEAIELYRELDRTLQVRVAQKVVLRADALDVQFRLAQEELSRVTRRNLLASQKERLNQLLGRELGTEFEVEPADEVSLLDVDIVAARARAVESRPDVREARLKLHQAELDHRVTKAGRIPDVSVVLSHTSNLNVDVLPTSIASAGVQLKWEPFDWGRRKHELVTKTATIEQARLAVRVAEDRVTLVINTRFRSLTEKRALLNVAALAQATSRERLRVKTNQFQLQAALLPDVLQLRAELASSDDRYQQVLLDFWTAKADYDRAVGEE